ASSSSAVKTETTSASSSSATKADSTSASSSSAVKTETTSASSSSATKADSTSASSSSAVKAETTSASSISATNAETTGASSISAVKTETTSTSSQKTNRTKRQARSLTTTTTGKALASDEAALTHVDKDNFRKYFSLNGSASYYDKYGIVIITPDHKNQVGNFSLTSKIDMNKSFTLTGQVDLGSNPNGADGIGFAFHSGNTNDVGNAGGNLGIGGLQDAIGFKLDTWFNSYTAPSSDKNGSEISPTDSFGFGWNGDSANAPYGTFVKTSNKEISTANGSKVQWWWARHAPYGTFVNGSKVQRWWAEDTGNPQALSKADIDGNFHNFVVNYDGAARTLTVSYTQASGKVLTWTTTVASSYQAMAMVVSASTGEAKNLQRFKLTSFDFQEAATVNVKYVDTTGHQLAQETVNYPDGAYVNGRYTTKQLIIPNYRFIKMDDGSVTGTKSLDANGTLIQAGDNGTVIYVYKPAYVTAESKTVNETVRYVDQHGHVVAKPHTDSVNFTRTVVVDNVTGEVITSGAGTKAWTATNGDTTFDAVVSPVVTGSVADKAQIAAVTDLNADSANVTETVTYTKVGSLVPSSSDGHFPRVPTVVYPNDPSDATKVTPAGVQTVPGYTAHDPEGHVLTPGSSYQPSDPTKDTTITYTADTQKGSVSYVDDTTGKTLKTDSISGTTGSKSSYSTSGNIADYKKHGYELVTDGYPADLTFDNNDTTDQNFTVHLKHQLTPVNPTDPQTPGAPINPDEPNGPKWPSRTNYDKTVNETVRYVDQHGHVVAKPHTDSVNFTRTVVVDNVTGEVIT
ncbi:lectin-like domain-containing protein, partial [Leuconostoc mesenteroides]|uniref:lectin-like domain-containing protein n=4 Tax=Leuconostoc mesenteroides TaxID=1245 RepID=UPI001CBDA37A